LLQQVWDGRRINQAEALRLYFLPLEELSALADRRRHLAKASAYAGRGNEIVTYIVDRNINYTNVCNVYCKFCAFYRTEKDADAYVITFDEIDRKIEETVALGGTQILMQGGHHPKLTKQWYLDLLAHIKTKFPQVNIHGFSPSEFVHFREVFDEPLDKIISEFKTAGLGSIPGGGGEILVDRVRQRISPLKAMSDDWLEVMDVAHRLGLNSSATMMFGHVETVEDRARASGGDLMNRRGVRLGRILGVEIFLHPSWFLLAGLIAFVLGQGFSTGSPSFSGAGAVVLGLMGAVLFFASLLAHELAHSVVAERKGIPVHRITLFLLGGAAQITREPSTAGDEAKIALAGPALSGSSWVGLVGTAVAAVVAGKVAAVVGFGSTEVARPVGSGTTTVGGSASVAMGATTTDAQPVTIFHKVLARVS